MKDFEKLLRGGDLRSTGNGSIAVTMVESQHDFDQLFSLVYSSNRVVAMCAADAVEKISVKNPLLLATHKHEVLSLAESVTHKEIKWHIAQLIPLLCLNVEELRFSWDILTNWAMDKTNSNIVRVNSLQGLFELTKINPCNNIALTGLLLKLEKENIPSIKARVRKLQSGLQDNWPKY
ncbi:MAG TPA: hypothetical protein VG738_13235 [Chitinophagaceae bacterium]|nr:hypothetical protein [Chitinophagaceae bacterium]